MTKSIFWPFYNWIFVFYLWKCESVLSVLAMIPCQIHGIVDWTSPLESSHRRVEVGELYFLPRHECGPKAAKRKRTLPLSCLTCPHVHPLYLWSSWHRPGMGTSYLWGACVRLRSLHCPRWLASPIVLPASGVKTGLFPKAVLVFLQSRSLAILLITDDGAGGLVTQLCLTLATSWTIAHQTPLSQFPRQEYWSE